MKTYSSLANVLVLPFGMDNPITTGTKFNDAFHQKSMGFHF